MRTKSNYGVIILVWFTLALLIGYILAKKTGQMTGFQMQGMTNLGYLKLAAVSVFGSLAIVKGFLSAIRHYQHKTFVNQVIH